MCLSEWGLGIQNFWDTSWRGRAADRVAPWEGEDGFILLFGCWFEYPAWFCHYWKLNWWYMEWTCVLCWGEVLSKPLSVAIIHGGAEADCIVYCVSLTEKRDNLSFWNNLVAWLKWQYFNLSGTRQILITKLKIMRTHYAFFNN